MDPIARIEEAGRDARGFTIMELMVVCSIIGIVALLAFPRMQSFMNAQDTKQSATQMAGVLEMARSRAVSEATPHLVYVNEPTVDDKGVCGPAATIVSDLDHDYKLSDGDRQQDIALSPEACEKLKEAAEGDTAEVFADLKLPAEDLAIRAVDSAASSTSGLVGDLVGGLVGGLAGESSSGEDSSGSGSGSSGSGSSGKGSGSSGKGSGKSSSGKGSGKATPARTATIAATAVNGATFPLDQESGLPVIAFTERGIPVDPRTPTRWGSGAGAIYLTDGKAAVYAAVVNPLGGVKLKKYEVTTKNWR